MSTNPQIVIPAPTGVNLSDESLETPANSAQQIAGLLCDRLGKIRSDINQVNACDLSLVASAQNIEPSSGLLYYIGEQVVTGTDIYGNPQNISFPNVGTDFLLILIGQSLYNAQYQKDAYTASLTALIPFVPLYPYKFQQPVGITDGPNGNFLSTPSRIRGAQYGNEMVIVQDGSITLNYRYYSVCDTNDPFASTTHIRTLGLPTPPALVLGTDINYNSPSGGHVARTGTPSYSVVYLDEFGRQSSPSIPVQLDFTSTNAGKNALISFTYTNPATYLAVVQIQIQEYVTGNANGYIIYTTGTLVTGANTISYEDGPTGTTDTTVEQGLVGPTPGENDPPNPASICCQYLDRMLLNDNTNPDTLQISNAGSPTQFNLLGYNPNAPNPAAGLRAPVNSDNGDAIFGAISFGTFAVILKTRGLYYLYGQNSSNFQIQQVGGAVGCAAKDSVQVLNNGTVFYLGPDGVYAFDGSTSNKISHQLDKAMLSYDSLTYSQAQSQYINRRYWLNIGADNWILDQDANGGQGDWIYFAYGITALEFIQQQYGQKYVPGEPNPGYGGTSEPPGGGWPGYGPVPIPQPSSVQSVYFLLDDVLADAGDDLTAHTPVIGGAYVKTDVAVGGVVVSGVDTMKPRPSLPNSSMAYVNLVTPPSADYEVIGEWYFADLTPSLQAMFMMARCQDTTPVVAGTQYIAYYNAGASEIEVDWDLASGPSSGVIGVFGFIPIAGSTHEVILRCKGNQISLDLDGVTVIGPVTDSHISLAGHVGVGAKNCSASFTDAKGLQFSSLKAKSI